MAIFVLRMKTFSRSAGSRGSRATSAAAYRAGERIRDERARAVYDHRRRQDVLHKEIVLPAALERGGAPMRWARDRTSLWNAAEHAETRRNSRVAREFMVALPHELGPGQRLQLARGFARELVERYHNAIDLVIHAPRGDRRNFHAHLLATTREVTREGLGRKAALELSGTERHRQGLLRWGEERQWLRERWASLTNEALQSAHLDARVSHEYVRARDPARMPRLPAMAYHIERRGGHSVVAERLRERHRALLEQTRAPSLTASGGPAPQVGPAPAQKEQAGWLRRVREHAQSAWLALRQHKGPQPLHDPAPVARVEAQPAPALRQRTERYPPFRAPVNAQAQASLERWNAYRREMNTHPDPAQESLQRWREYRSQVKEHPDPAQESRERWNAYRREMQTHPESALQKQRQASASQQQETSHGIDLDLGL